MKIQSRPGSSFIRVLQTNVIILGICGVRMPRGLPNLPRGITVQDANKRVSPTLWM